MTSPDPQHLREGVVRVDASGLSVLRATGADRIAFLHRLTTGSVQSTPVGQSCRSLMLDSKAHILGDFRIGIREEDVRVVLVGGDAQSMAATLSRYAVMDDFTIAVEPELKATALYGPEAPSVLRSAGISWERALAVDGSHTEANSPFGPFWLLSQHAMGTTGLWVWGDTSSSSALDAALQKAGVPLLDNEVAEALRILAGEPRAGAEWTGNVLPMEVGLSNALDNKKGCYLGQETVVRVRDRGMVRRRLVGLLLRGEIMPTVGAAIAFGDKDEAGRVTSVGRLPGQPPVALALLSTAVPVGAEVHIKQGHQSSVAEVMFERPPW